MNAIKWILQNTREYILFTTYWALMIFALVAIGVCALCCAAGAVVCIMALIGMYVVYPDSIDMMAFGDVVLYVLAVAGFTYLLYMVSKFSYERLEKRKWWTDIRL